MPLFADIDVVYFVAGLRGKDLLQVDAYGAVKTMQAAQKADVARYVMLSALKSLEPDAWDEKPYSNIKNYYIAKYFADYYLVHNSGLNYTIVQPTNLTENPAKGKVDLPGAGEKENSIEDVARVLASVIDYPNTQNAVIPMSSGNVAISDALTAF